MVEPNYNIKDKAYFSLIGEVSEELSNSNINYALVGGAAVQVRVASILSAAKQGDIGMVDDLDLLLRETKDIDITSNADDGKFMYFFNEWQVKNPNIMLKHLGEKRKEITFVTCPKTIDVILNYQTEPNDLKGLDENAFYECIDTATPVELWYDNKRIETVVALPEYIVASKLTRAEEKDKFDISVLLKTTEKYGPRIDFNKIKFILERAGKNYKYQVLEDIISGILKK